MAVPERKNSKQTQNYRAKYRELWNRVIKKVTGASNLSHYTNGDDDLYPNSIDRVIRQSTTAKSAAGVMAKYIGGKGVDVSGDNIVNKQANQTLNSFVKECAKVLSFQGGVFVHVGYSIDEQINYNEDGLKVKFKPSNLTVLQYMDVRINKVDDDGLLNTFSVSNREESGVWNKGKGIKNYYTFNKNPKVIEAQIRNDWEDKNKKLKREREFNIVEAIKNYSGQVFYLNLTPGELYARAYVDAAYNDADTEMRIALYNNTQAREGYNGKIVVESRHTTQEEQEDFADAIKQMMGVENSGGMTYVPVAGSAELGDFFRIHQIKPSFDDKLYTETKISIRENILGQFNNVPEALVFSPKGGMFATSGEAYTQMKIFYSEQTLEERNALEEMIYQILGLKVNIIPLSKTE